MRLAKVTQPAQHYQTGRTIILITKDNFINNLPDLSQMLYVLKGAFQGMKEDCNCC